jgi:hypothetical protein
MSKMDASVLWGPNVVGRASLGERRWIYAVEAPFDMPRDIPDLIGMRVHLNGGEFEIRGIVPKMPAARIVKGEIIELLVRAIQGGRRDQV